MFPIPEEESEKYTRAGNAIITGPVVSYRNVTVSLNGLRLP